MATAWLERRQLPGVSGLITLLTANKDKPYKVLAPIVDDGDPVENRDGFCPIMTGAYLSDMRKLPEQNMPIKLGPTQSPVLLLPFLSSLAAVTASRLSLHCREFRIAVDRAGIEILGDTTGLNCRLTETITISLAERRPTVRTEFADRVDIPEDSKACLELLASRTFVRETELSRRTGAGGGTVDDD